MTDDINKSELYSIGTLSKIVGISVDTLRYYDEIGLFKPAQISFETGYRYYSADQAPMLTQIIELKQYGFSLNEIKEILTNAGLSREDVYSRRYWALVREKKKLQEALNKLAEKIKCNQEEDKMNKRILLADDAAFMRMTCRDILEREGYQVAGEAYDGEQAVAKYKEARPDLVLLDIVMPNMDGIEALRQIKSFDPDANAVMLSALGKIKPVAEALIAGACDFLVKPFQAENLLIAVCNSFQPKAGYNQEIVNRISSGSYDESYVLTQEQINRIIAAARSGEMNPGIESIITSLGELPEHDPVLVRLDKLEKTQDEILSLLRQMGEKP
jgi:two-component system chemotaxis response regulator CheY